MVHSSFRTGSFHFLASFYGHASMVNINQEIMTFRINTIQAKPTTAFAVNFNRCEECLKLEFLRVNKSAIMKNVLSKRKSRSVLPELAVRVNRRKIPHFSLFDQNFLWKLHFRNSILGVTYEILTPPSFEIIQFQSSNLFFENGPLHKREGGRADCH